LGNLHGSSVWGNLTKKAFEIVLFVVSCRVAAARHGKTSRRCHATTGTPAEEAPATLPKISHLGISFVQLELGRKVLNLGRLLIVLDRLLIVRRDALPELPLVLGERTALGLRRRKLLHLEVLVSR